MLNDTEILGGFKGINKNSIPSNPQSEPSGYVGDMSALLKNVALVMQPEWLADTTLELDWLLQIDWAVLDNSPVACSGKHNRRHPLEEAAHERGNQEMSLTLSRPSPKHFKQVTPLSSNSNF